MQPDAPSEKAKGKPLPANENKPNTALLGGIRRNIQIMLLGAAVVILVSSLLFLNSHSRKDRSKIAEEIKPTVTVVSSITPEKKPQDSSDSVQTESKITPTQVPETPTPTLTNTPTPVPPTPTPECVSDSSKSYYNLQGTYVDGNNAPISIPEQVITVINVCTKEVRTSHASPSWSFSNLPQARYQIKAEEISGYSVSSNPCHGCNFHPNYGGPVTTSVDFILNPGVTYVDIGYQYIKL